MGSNTYKKGFLNNFRWYCSLEPLTGGLVTFNGKNSTVCYAVLAVNMRETLMDPLILHWDPLDLAQHTLGCEQSLRGIMELV